MKKRIVNCKSLSSPFITTCNNNYYDLLSFCDIIGGPLRFNLQRMPAGNQVGV